MNDHIMENHDMYLMTTMIFSSQLGRKIFNRDIYSNIRPLSENSLAEYEKITPC
jgi:hypothetical protein